MFSALLAATLILAASPPDHSKKYFTGLDRPSANRVTIGPSEGPVILIVIDALRPDRMSTYGAPRETTPSLDTLANDGLVFTNFFTNGNWTRPTTASLLSGMLPHEHGVERDTDRLADRYRTLPELLKASGMATGAVVGNGNAGSVFGLNQGFDEYADTVHHWEGLPSADEVVDLAIPFVTRHRDNRFFLMLFFIDPHDPYHAPGGYEDMFVSDPGTRLVRSPHWELGSYTDEERDRMTAVYDGAVRYTDAALGRFFGELRKLGVYDKSTIVVTSDHGEAFGEHGVYLHSHHLYDELTRAPLIVRTPEMSTRGAYTPILAQTVDLLPTLVKHAGGEVHDPVHGVDLFEQTGEPARVDPNRVVISEFSNFGIRRRMARGYQQKAIVQFAADEPYFMATVGKKSLLPSVIFSDEEWTFFRIDRDPLEKNNLYSPSLARKPGWSRLVRILRAQEARRAGRDVQVVENIDPETLGDLKSLGYIQ